MYFKCSVQRNRRSCEHFHIQTGRSAGSDCIMPVLCMFCCSVFTICTVLELVEVWNTQSFTLVNQQLQEAITSPLEKRVGVCVPICKLICPSRVDRMRLWVCVCVWPSPSLCVIEKYVILHWKYRFSELGHTDKNLKIWKNPESPVREAGNGGCFI